MPGALGGGVEVADGGLALGGIAQTYGCCSWCPEVRRGIGGEQSPRNRAHVPPQIRRDISIE